MIPDSPARSRFGIFPAVTSHRNPQLNPICGRAVPALCAYIDANISSASSSNRIEFLTGAPGFSRIASPYLQSDKSCGPQTAVAASPWPWTGGFRTRRFVWHSCQNSAAFPRASLPKFLQKASASTRATWLSPATAHRHSTSRIAHTGLHRSLVTMSVVWSGCRNVEIGFKYRAQSHLHVVIRLPLRPLDSYVPESPRPSLKNLICTSLQTTRRCHTPPISTASPPARSSALRSRPSAFVHCAWLPSPPAHLCDISKIPHGVARFRTASLPLSSFPAPRMMHRKGESKSLLTAWIFSRWQAFHAHVPPEPCDSRSPFRIPAKVISQKLPRPRAPRFPAPKLAQNVARIVVIKFLRSARWHARPRATSFRSPASTSPFHWQGFFPIRPI